MIERDAPRRFTDLPPETRKFIRGLGEDDLETLKRVIGVFRMVSGWCRINRWLFIGGLALLIMLSQALDAVKAFTVKLFGH